MKNKLIRDFIYEYKHNFCGDKYDLPHHLIIEITSDEKGETSHFMPAEDIKNLTLGTMIDKLESRGQWKIDLDVSELFTEEWSKAMEQRWNYLHALRDIKLQDLNP